MVNVSLIFSFLDKHLFVKNKEIIAVNLGIVSVGLQSSFKLEQKIFHRHFHFNHQNNKQLNMKTTQLCCQQ